MSATTDETGAHRPAVRVLDRFTVTAAVAGSMQHAMRHPIAKYRMLRVLGRLKMNKMAEEISVIERALLGEQKQLLRISDRVHACELIQVATARSPLGRSSACADAELLAVSFLLCVTSGCLSVRPASCR
jgi:hypothetical protein